MSPFGNDAKHSNRFRDKPGIASGISPGQLTPAYASAETLDFVQSLMTSPREGCVSAIPTESSCSIALAFWHFKSSRTCVYSTLAAFVLLGLVERLEVAIFFCPRRLGSVHYQESQCQQQRQIATRKANLNSQLPEARIHD
jgi:hypothetical protein